MTQEQRAAVGAIKRVLQEHRMERHSIATPGKLEWWGHCRCGFEGKVRTRSYVGWELDMADDESAHAAHILVSELGLVLS